MVAETPANGESKALTTVDQTNTLVAVGSAASYVPGDLEAIKKLVTQTKAIGVILPPPDIRAIVDKTAQFVARNGVEFEKRILANEKNNVKFNFLNPTDPYHAYYKVRVKDFAEGEAKEAAAEGAEAADTRSQQQKEEAAKQAAAAAEAAVAAAPSTVVPAALKALEKPEDEKYTVHVPEGLTAMDLEIIKLTAQMTARNGKNFLQGLAMREATNPQFAFIKPTHSLFGFFTTLCDAYSNVTMPERGGIKDVVERLQRDATDRAPILERSLKRLEWERVREKEAKDAADEAERERMAMQSIDWHDFVIVETITFDEEEDAALPPPMSLREVVAMNKAKDYIEEQQAQQEAQQQEGAAAGAGAMDEEERALVAEGVAAAAGERQQQQEQAAAAAGTEAAAVADGAAVAEEVSEEMDMDEEEDQLPIKIVKNYQRPAARQQQGYDPTKFAISPITGELVPIADMEEHMRISLIDPKYLEQREAMLAKLRDTTKAADDEITRNLVRLARTRPDIFGSTEQEVTQAVATSIKEKQTTGNERPIAWDGATTKGPVLNNQVRAIQEQRQEQQRSTPAVSMPKPVLGPPPPVRPPQPVLRPPPVVQPPPLAPPPVARPPPAAPSQGAPPSMALPPPPARPVMQPPPLPAAPAMPPMPAPRPPMMMPPAPRPAPPMPGPPQPAPHMPGPPGPSGPPGPALPREAPPPMPADGPAFKRQRVNEPFVLEPEESFLERFPGASKVRVQCPDVEGNEKLIGQILEVEVASLADSVADFKGRLAVVLGLAANKLKLQREEVGFLRDELSLAHYNVTPEVLLQLALKERGKKK